MNIGYCINLSVIYFVGYGKIIDANVSSQHANAAVKAWRQENSIQPDMLPEYAAFMGASELTELRKHPDFKEPCTVLDEAWKAELDQRLEKDPKYEPKTRKGFEDIEEGDFTYEDSAGDTYHVIWGKSFVEDEDLKTDVGDIVKVGKVRIVEKGGKKVEKGGAEVTLSVKKHLTPKMIVTKGINAITSRWEKKGIPTMEHNRFVEMRVGVFMLKCINTRKWNPTRSVVVLKLRYKSGLSDAKYFLKQIKAYRERTYIPKKSEEDPSANFQDNLKYNANVSRQAAEDLEKWILYENTIPKVVQQATKDTRLDVRQNAKTNKPMQQTPSPSKNPASQPQQTDSHTSKEVDAKAIIKWHEEKTKATAEAAKQKTVNEQDEKTTDTKATANVAKIVDEWNERVKKADLDILKTVYEARFRVLEEAKKRAIRIGYEERKNMYRIELNIPKPSSPLKSIFTEEEYVIYKILEKKNEFPYFLYKHASDVGFGYQKTPDGKSYAAVVLIQVGDSVEKEQDLNTAIYKVTVANLREAMDASARLFNDEKDTLPAALYELVYGVTNEEMSKVEAEVMQQLQDQGLNAEQKHAKVKAAQYDHITNSLKKKVGEESQKKVVGIADAPPLKITGSPKIDRESD